MSKRSDRNISPLAKSAKTRPGKAPVVEATDFDTGAGDDPALTRPATPRVIDFAAAARMPNPKNPLRIIDGRESDPEGHVLTTKRVRARARRRFARGQKLIDEAVEHLWKPIEEWDMEELARGRPRNASGGFTGPRPKYISREIHEQAMDRFKDMVRADMAAKTVDALMVYSQILTNDEVDNRGRPVVPPSTRLDAAKFLMEHVVGKAVQPTTTDISAKLQLILGQAMVNPDDAEAPAQLEGYSPGHIGWRQEAADPDADEDDIEDAEVIEWN